MSTELQLDGFLDDYFAECDEHLTEARRNLLALEAALRMPGTERQPLENLFRIFHSIKGISGMVELREAEQLAHEMESYLRALRRRDTLLTAEGVDALIDGAQRLEQVVAARSRDASIPSIADLERRLAALVPDVAAAPTPVHVPDTGPAAAFRVRWSFRFVGGDEQQTDAALGGHGKFLRFEVLPVYISRRLHCLAGRELVELRAPGFVSLRLQHLRPDVQLHREARDVVGEIAANQPHGNRAVGQIADRTRNAGHLLHVGHLELGLRGHALGEWNTEDTKDTQENLCVPCATRISSTPRLPA